MDILQALILSIVEGLTEFLPVSSTGHLILTTRLLNIPQTDFVKSFEIIIQSGAILAILILYWQKLTTGLLIWKKILTAFIPTALVGFTLYQLVKDLLLGNVLITLSALFLGGIFLILLELIYKDRSSRISEIEHIQYSTALLIGLFQSLALVPGVSRSAATIFGGLFLGLNRKTAVEFSFLLALPTLTAATALDIFKSNMTFSASEYWLLLIGLTGSFITALIAIKFLLSYIQNHTFIPFGIYRIILALIFWLIIL